VYDVPGKCVIKQITTVSSILHMQVDPLEMFVYLACDNLNVYQFALSSPPDAAMKHRKTLTHKKRVCAMCLSVDGRHLVTGDAQGLIYIWTLKEDTGSASQNLPLQTFEIHKDKGPITNLVAINRPLSLFGLTANMQGYEPGEIKPLHK
jgi:WD40 repeat protein